MFFKILIVSVIENILNTFFYHHLLTLKTVYQQLSGKVLCITLKKFNTSIILVFGDLQIDVLGKWEGEVNCSIIIHSKVLLKLNNLQQLTTLIRNGILEVEGDLQILYNLIILVNLVEFNLSELIAPYVGDIIAEGVSKFITKNSIFLCKRVQHLQCYVTEVLTEEWHIAPGTLEVAGFTEETTAINFATELLTKRLKKLEGK